jgi:hypothetical protein
LKPGSNGVEDVGPEDQRAAAVVADEPEHGNRAPLRSAQGTERYSALRQALDITSHLTLQKRDRVRTFDAKH